MEKIEKRIKQLNFLIDKALDFLKDQNRSREARLIVVQDIARYYEEVLILEKIIK